MNTAQKNSNKNEKLVGLTPSTPPSSVTRVAVAGGIVVAGPVAAAAPATCGDGGP